MTKQIVSTKEISVNIQGIEYDCFLIPKDPFVDVDYKDCPENHPRVRRLIEKIRKGEVK